jgi:predicted HTH domain antitoxin
LEGNSVLTVQDLVRARLYDNEEAAIQDALRHLLRGRPDACVQLAVYRYQTDDSVSLAKAASLAGISWSQMKDILLERGIQPRLGPETLDEAKREIQALREHFEVES